MQYPPSPAQRDHVWICLHCLRMSRGDTTGASRCLCFGPLSPFSLFLCHGVSLSSRRRFISHLLVVAHVSDAWIRGAPYRARPAHARQLYRSPPAYLPQPTILLLRHLHPTPQRHLLRSPIIQQTASRGRASDFRVLLLSLSLSPLNPVMAEALVRASCPAGCCWGS